MELEIKQQAICLAWGLGLGFGLGLVYELMRLCRKKTGLHLLADTLFALCCFLCAFLYGMNWAKGRLGLWEISALSAGFCTYMAVFAPVLLRAFRRLKNF